MYPPELRIKLGAAVTTKADSLVMKDPLQAVQLYNEALKARTPRSVSAGTGGRAPLAVARRAILDQACLSVLTPSTPLRCPFPPTSCDQLTTSC